MSDFARLSRAAVGAFLLIIHKVILLLGFSTRFMFLSFFPLMFVILLQLDLLLYQSARLPSRTLFERWVGDIDGDTMILIFPVCAMIYIVIVSGTIVVRAIWKSITISFFTRPSLAEFFHSTMLIFLFMTGAFYMNFGIYLITSTDTKYANAFWIDIDYYPSINLMLIVMTVILFCTTISGMFWFAYFFRYHQINDIEIRGIDFFWYFGAIISVLLALWQANEARLRDSYDSKLRMIEELQQQVEVFCEIVRDKECEDLQPVIDMDVIMWGMISRSMTNKGFEPASEPIERIEEALHAWNQKNERARYVREKMKQMRDRMDEALDTKVAEGGSRALRFSILLFAGVLALRLARTLLEVVHSAARRREARP